MRDPHRPFFYFIFTPSKYRFLLMSSKGMFLFFLAESQKKFGIFDY